MIPQAPAFDTPVEEARVTGSLLGLPHQHFINGRPIDPAGNRWMDTFDPGTGLPFARVPRGDRDDVDAAVEAARRALRGPWRRAVPVERGRVLSRIAERLRLNAERLAVVECLDTGKRLSEARGDVASAAATFDYYAGACDKDHGLSIPLGNDHLAWTVNEPAGVTAHVIPWNYPLSTAARGIAPALAAGCTVVAKPAEQAPLSTLLLAALAAEAGLPDGVLNVVCGTGVEAGAPLVRHPEVRHVSFTGSVTTGIDVMAAAAPQLTRLLLELGGKSPVVVMADADLDRALEDVLGAIFENAGQICSAGSRLLVERRIHDDFVEQLARRTRAMTLAHGLRDAGMGPLNSKAQQARVSGFVTRALDRGAERVTGGKACADPVTGLGWFHEPTILDRLAPDDEAVREEIFGPVLVVQSFDVVEEAVALANGTPYALAAGIYTRNFGVAHQLARDIDAGQVYINEYFAGGVALPFGGNRRSGYGREKGMEALRSYSRTKAVAARISDAADSASAEDPVNGTKAKTGSTPDTPTTSA